MNRLLFIIVIIAVIYWWVKSTRKQQQNKQDEAPPRAEDMVRCAQCGIHLPRSEGYLVGGKYYCSEAHSRAQSGKSD